MSRKFKIIDYQFINEKAVWTYIHYAYGHCYFLKKFPDGFQNVLERSNVSGRRMLYMTKKIKNSPIYHNKLYSWFKTTTGTITFAIHNEDETIAYWKSPNLINGGHWI